MATPLAAAPAYRSLELPDVFDLLDLHEANPARYPYLLESVAHDDLNARFDILFACPQQTLALNRLDEDDFLNRFDREWRREAIAPVTSPLPFTGGWFLYLSYELAAQIEPTVRLHDTRPEFPIAFATRIPAAIVRDRASATTHVVCEEAYARELWPQLLRDIAQRRTRPQSVSALAHTQEEAPEIYLNNIAAVQDFIRAGDVFQVNLSRAWTLTLQHPATAAAVYRQLRSANPAPYAGLVTRGDCAIVSSSPERLLSVRAGVVRTRPIAGTFPRSADPAHDAQLSRELLAHPKERAEHIMLIDLERNDLGRICEIGSVRAQELMTLETYRYVHHIVSEVSGRLRGDVTPAACIRALFPGGTITGCPKVRCMQIIHALERAPRGAYTGSMGYINRDGSMDLNILIRTLTHCGDTLHFRAGGGIVADSIPAHELAETRAKAEGLLRAFSDG